MPQARVRTSTDGLVLLSWSSVFFHGSCYSKALIALRSAVYPIEGWQIVRGRAAILSNNPLVSHDSLKGTLFDVARGSRSAGWRCSALRA
jgi:hypothetical protein